MLQTRWALGGTEVVMQGSGARANAALFMLQNLERDANSAKDSDKQKLREIIKGLKDEEVLEFVDKLLLLVENAKRDVPVITSAVNELVREFNERSTSVAQLKDKVKVLEEKMAELQAKLASQDQKILLGQVAYVLDEVAADFVFAGAKRPRNCSIGLIRSTAADGDLTEEQKQRWLQFKEAMRTKGWTVLDLVGTTGMLRTNRYDTAHGTAEKRKAVTVSQLKTWTGKYFEDTDDADSIQRLMELVSLFTQPNQPLCKADNSSDIVKEVLRSKV